MSTSVRAPLRLTAAIGALALGIGGALLATTPAFAAPGDGGTGSITVHKFAQRDAASFPAGSNNGSELTLPSNLTPLAAGFTVCTITGINLANAADWDRLSDLSLSLVNNQPSVSENGTPLPAPTCDAERTTDAATGATTFSGLAADRAYVVFESTAPANAIPSTVLSLVTVPYPGSGAAGQPVWNYNPHIYPKNTLVGAGATKTASMLGDVLSFEILEPVPALPSGETFSNFIIADQLSTSLKYTGGSVALVNSAGVPVTLTAGTHYTLTAPTPAVTTGGENVVLEFTTAGLLLLDANPRGEIQLGIQTKALSSGDTANEATVTINGVTTDPGDGPKVEDDEVETYYAGAHVRVEAENKGATVNVPQAGATFNVYEMPANTTSCPATSAALQNLAISGAVSGANGRTPAQVLPAGPYCVYETGIPAGYRSTQAGVFLAVGDPDDVANPADNYVTFVNEQIGSQPGDLPALPITGAVGTVLLITGGAALLTAAIVLLMVRRRQQQG